MENGLKKEDSLALKGMAILMMVFYHCYYKATKFQKYDVVFRGFSADQVITVASCMKICVALFAFVSGYGLMYGYKKEKETKSSFSDSRWALRHLFSTLSGYWFTAAVAYAGYALFIDRSFRRLGDVRIDKLTAMGMDLLGISWLTGTRSLNGTWWYMSAAIIFILCIPLFYRAVRQWGAVIPVIMIFIFPRVTGIGFPGSASSLSFLMILMIGSLCAQYDFFSCFRSLGNQYRSSRVWKGILLFLCLSAAFWLYPKLNVKIIWEYQYAAVPFLVILFSVEYLFRISWVSRFFQYFGRHSLNIWLIHTFIRDYMGETVFSVREFWLVPVVILMISLAVSYVIELLKKVTGYQKLVRYVLQKLR